MFLSNNLEDCNKVKKWSNEDTYCSIYEMAEMVADRIAGGKIKVRIEESTDNDRGGRPKPL